jgi:3-oxoacyl-[acyl-carrier protein] reductase
MELNLKDKTALVTGASGGIGAATARLLAEEGADVVICYYQNDAGAERTVNDIERLGRRAWMQQMDLSDPDAVAQSMKNVAAEVETVDVVVLCAGENTVVPFDELTVEEWSRIVNVNLNGAFAAIQATRPLLRPGSSIVTVASVAAHTGAPHHAHYAAAKAGLINLTKSAARALAPDVRVNCVAPGVTLTPMGAVTAQNLPANYAKEKLLLQRFAQPDEIARCIVFLASPVASFVTGATLDANGGRDLR